jgi:hypothetical protein
MVDEVRQVFSDEASDICQHTSECMDFEPAHSARSARSATATGTAAPSTASPSSDTGDEHSDCEDDRRTDAVVTRHRFSKRRNADHAARRIITLRDRRRGRPPKTRHGSDPPA